MIVLMASLEWSLESHPFLEMQPHCWKDPSDTGQVDGGSSGKQKHLWIIDVHPRIRVDDHPHAQGHAVVHPSYFTRDLSILYDCRWLEGPRDARILVSLET